MGEEDIAVSPLIPTGYSKSTRLRRPKSFSTKGLRQFHITLKIFSK